MDAKCRISVSTALAADPDCYIGSTSAEACLVGSTPFEMAERFPTVTIDVSRLGASPVMKVHLERASAQLELVAGPVIEKGEPPRRRNDSRCSAAIS
jgi:hypothetical protein